MSMMEKAFMVIALAELVFMLALLRVVRQEADGARELLNVLRRQYDEMRALAVMNAWALDRAFHRLVEARALLANLADKDAEMVISLAIQEVHKIEKQDPVTWRATPVDLVVLTSRTVS